MALIESRLSSVEGVLCLVVRILEPHLGPGQATADVRDAIAKVVAQHKKCKLVIDFSQVAHWTSAAFEVLLFLRKLVEADGGGMAVCNLAPELETSYKLCMLQRIIPIADTVEKACKTFGRETSGHGHGT